MSRILYELKKWLFCSWVHNRYKCYPDVGGKGLDGVWHCSECHPCGEELWEAIRRLSPTGEIE